MVRTIAEVVVPNGHALIEQCLAIGHLVGGEPIEQVLEGLAELPVDLVMQQVGALDWGTAGIVR